ncbi:hypothetical protein MHYP_G00205400 [Metynnis hypsauchen]
MVNYLSKFCEHLADDCEVLRQLTHKDAVWEWSDVQENAFKKLKRTIATASVLKYYDPEEDLTLQCDSSETGLGAALMKAGQPIAYGSRALTPTERGYAQIEKECLAILFGMEKFHQYTYGRKVEVQSDHKPLETIMRKPLFNAPKRLQRMLLRLQKYDISVTYVPGRLMHVGDTLSRAYLPEGDTAGSVEAEIETINMIQYLPISEERLRNIQAETEKDKALQSLKQIILQGWPKDKAQMMEEVRPFFAMQDELSVQHVDYFSNFWEVNHLPDTSSATFIHKLKAHFARHGIPDVVVSDNGPQYSSGEFRKFSKAWDFEHVTSSPTYPQSNGKAESAVKTAKGLMGRAIQAKSDPYLAILDHRNAPSQGFSASPAQRLMSRRTKTLLPTCSTLPQPVVMKTNQSMKQNQSYNRGVEDLSDLKSGDRVRVQTENSNHIHWTPGTVMDQVNNRFYAVKLDSGTILRRNRRHLRTAPRQDQRNMGGKSETEHGWTTHREMSKQS